MIFGGYIHLKDKKVLEIGAGSGGNLLDLMKLGFLKKNIYANEINPHRSERIKDKIDEERIFVIDAIDLDINVKFDLILQSTVFSSILDYSVKEKLARKSYSMLIDGGCFIWYDFKYDNPFNADVKGISKSEVRRLFPDAVRIDFTNVTLAPPISRKIPKLYALVNFLFPFLRTHFVAVVHKD